MDATNASDIGITQLDHELVSPSLSLLQLTGFFSGTTFLSPCEKNVIKFKPV